MKEHKEKGFQQSVWDSRYSLLGGSDQRRIPHSPPSQTLTPQSQNNPLGFREVGPVVLVLNKLHTITYVEKRR